MNKGGFKYKRSITKRMKKKAGKSKKVNLFIKKTIKAKKENKSSFEYKGVTYKRKTKGPLVFYSKSK